MTSRTEFLEKHARKATGSVIMNNCVPYARFFNTQILSWLGFFHLSFLIYNEKFRLTKYFGKPIMHFLLLMSTVYFDNYLCFDD